MTVRVFIGLAASLILAGCASGYHVDATQYVERSAAMAARDNPTPPRQVVTRSTAPEGPIRTAHAGVTQDDGTVGDATQIRPWPKRGTPEYERLLAEESAQEERVKNAVNSICRGC